MRHILAVKKSKVYNLGTNSHDYLRKISVSQDVIDFLNIHDIEMDSEGRRIYIMNKVKYVYLGLDFSEATMLDKLNEYQTLYNFMMERLEILLKKEIDKAHEKK